MGQHATSILGASQADVSQIWAGSSVADLDPVVLTHRNAALVALLAITEEFWEEGGEVILCEAVAVNSIYDWGLRVRLVRPLDPILSCKPIGLLTGMRYHKHARCMIGGMLVSQSF